MVFHYHLPPVWPLNKTPHNNIKLRQYSDVQSNFPAQMFSHVDFWSPSDQSDFPLFDRSVEPLYRFPPSVCRNVLSIFFLFQIEASILLIGFRISFISGQGFHLHTSSPDTENELFLFPPARKKKKKHQHTVVKIHHLIYFPLRCARSRLEEFGGLVTKCPFLKNKHYFSTVRVMWLLLWLLCTWMSAASSPKM